MRIKLAALALFLAAGQANGLSPAAINSPTTLRIYGSGEPELNNILAQIFLSFCSSHRTVYYNESGSFSGTFPAQASGFQAGQAHRVYACRQNSSVLAGGDTALFLSSLGGSDQGIFPVFLGSQPPFPKRPFLQVASANCRLNPNPYESEANFLCSGERFEAPHFGTSLLEPSMFESINMPSEFPLPVSSSGLSEEQLGEMQIEPLFQTVFAVAVNKSLRDAMQAKQGLSVGRDDEANRPSISRIEAANYFVGFFQDPSSLLGWQPIVSASDPKRGTQVNICRGIPGSGVQAAANNFLSEFPCNLGTFSPMEAGSSADAGIGSNGRFHVRENRSPGIMTCLTQAEASGAYAIGHVAKLNQELGSAWRHVRLDGIAPTRDNVKSGKYSYFYEATLQYPRNLNPFARSFVENLAQVASRPEVLWRLSAATQDGIAALPDTYHGQFGTGSVPEIRFGSRVSRGGQSCIEPFHVK